MPRRLTRPEAITRIAITALHAAFPAMTSRQLVGFFQVSPRTVTEAMRHAASNIHLFIKAMWLIQLWWINL
jgi:hypothetical protein